MKRSNLLQFTRKRGFALIITIVLVAFLVLILVGLATFTRVETQVASNAQDMAKARQNALMALNIAMGELQVAAGPDSRVTAPAEASPAASVLGAGLPVAPSTTYNQAAWTTYENDLAIYWGNSPAWRSPQWVGVWRNIDAPPSLKPRLVNWLVSGNEQVWDPVTPPANHTTPTFTPSQTVLGLALTTEAASLSPTVNRRPAVVLVGNRSTSDNVNPSAPVTAAESYRYVVAPKVDIRGPLPDGSTRVIGRYAWWVGDQGVKAALNAAYPPLVNTTPALNTWQEQINGMQSPGRAGLEVIWGTNFDSNPNWLKVLQLSQASFAPTAPNTIQPNAVREKFHDIAAQSYGLLTDTLNGGFKTDLTTSPAALPAVLGGVNLTAYFPSSTTATIPANGVLTTATKADPDLNAWTGTIPSQLPAPFQDRVINTIIAPVVADAKLTLRFRYNAGKMETRIGTELLLWNPYTADFTWTEIKGGNTYRNGYRYRVQWMYNDTENGGSAWDGKVSVGYIYTDGVGAYVPGGGVITVPLNLFGADTHSPARLGVTVRDIVSDAPANHTTASITPTNARLRAGETALYQQVAGAATLGMKRSADAFGFSDFNDLGNFDPNVTFPGTPPASAAAMEARPLMHFTAAPTNRKVHLVVYARYVDETSADLPNGGAIGTDGPTGVKETTVFDQLITLTLPAAAPIAPVDLASWNANWKNGPVPATTTGVFAGTQSLADISFNGVTDFYATFHSTNIVNTTNAFWLNYANPDPRDSSARGFELLLEEGSVTATNTSLTWGGLDATTTAQLPQTPPPAALISERDQFPMLFEAAREQPVSIVQLGAAPNLGGTASSWLGLAPAGAPAGNQAAITALNQAVLDGFYFSTLPGSLVAANLPTERLRNKRYELAPIQGRTNAQNLNYLNAVGGRPPAAALKVLAPFNINSVSQSGWAVQLKTGGQQMTGVVWDNSSNQFYARTDTLGSNVGRFRQAPGLSYSFRVREQSSTATNGEGSIYRNGQRELSPLDLYARTPNALDPAQRVVINVNDQVKPDDIPDAFARIVRQANLVRVGNGGVNAGPVFSVAEFANGGALETAIANVPWTLGSGVTRNGLNWQRTDSANAWNDFSTMRGTPSYLSQRDLLQALAPVLSARSDTFVIRTYGEAVNPAAPTEVVGKVWCEAIVVRSADYVDDGAAAGQKPEDAFASLNNTNKNFGRRFRIIAFRWLGSDDI